MFSTKLRLMLGGGFLALMGMILLFSGLGAYFHTHSFIKKGIKTDGRILRIVDGQKPNVHYAIYVFKDPEGTWHEVYSDVGVHPAPANAQRWDQVSLIYTADDPGHGIRVTFWNLWADAVKQSSYGAVALLLGLGVLYIAKSQ